jgi:hypothetical protein
MKPLFFVSESGKTWRRKGKEKRRGREGRWEEKKNKKNWFGGPDDFQVSVPKLSVR